MKVKLLKTVKCLSAYDFHGPQMKLICRSTTRDREPLRKAVEEALTKGIVLLVGDNGHQDAHAGISALFQKRGSLKHGMGGPRGKRRTYRRCPLGYLVWAVHQFESVPVRNNTKFPRNRVDDYGDPRKKR